MMHFNSGGVGVSNGASAPRIYLPQEQKLQLQTVGYLEDRGLPIEDCGLPITDYRFKIANSRLRIAD